MHAQLYKVLARMILLVMMSFALLPVHGQTRHDDRKALFAWIDDGGKYTSHMAKLHGKKRYTAFLNEEAFGSAGLGEAKRIVMNITPELTIVPTRQHFEDRGRNGGTWFGHVEKVPGSEVILTHAGGWLGGYVAYEGRNFWILLLSRSQYERPLYEIVELDDESFPPPDRDVKLRQGEPGPGALAGRYSGVMRWLGTDATADDWNLYRDLVIKAAQDDPLLRPIPEDGSNIDVLVVYTPQALYFVDNPLNPFDNPVENMDGFIQLAFDQANKSFMNSEIPTRYNLVTPPIMVDYKEIDIDADATLLRNFDDDFLNSVHYLRNVHAADIVVMMTATDGSPNNDTVCGRVFVRRHAVNLLDFNGSREAFEAAEAANAFAVIKISCAISSQYAFTHELGHLLGAQHDRFKQPNIDGTFEDDARGWTAVPPHDPTKAFRTMMAGENLCEQELGIYCPTWLYWSDPDKVILNAPLGIPEFQVGAADSQAVLTSKTIIPVSNYRWWGCRYMACSGLQGPVPE